MTHQGFHIWTPLWLFSWNLVLYTFLPLLKGTCTPHLPCLITHPRPTTPLTSLSSSTTSPLQLLTSGTSLALLDTPSSWTLPSFLWSGHPLLALLHPQLFQDSFNLLPFSIHTISESLVSTLTNDCKFGPDPSICPLASLLDVQFLLCSSSQETTAPSTYSLDPEVSMLLEFSLIPSLPMSHQTQAPSKLSPPSPLSLLRDRNIHAPSNPLSALLSVNVPKCKLLLFLLCLTSQSLR